MLDVKRSSAKCFRHPAMISFLVFDIAFDNV
jgi:hypothetical protein